MERYGRLFSDGLEVDQVVDVYQGPIPGGLRIIELDDVAPEREHDDVVVMDREREVAGAVFPDLLSRPFCQELGQAAVGVDFLCVDDLSQPQGLLVYLIYD